MEVNLRIIITTNGINGLITFVIFTDLSLWIIISSEIIARRAYCVEVPEIVVRHVSSVCLYVCLSGRYER